MDAMAALSTSRPSCQRPNDLSFTTLKNWYLSGVEKPTRLRIWRYIWNNSLHRSTSHFSQKTTTSSFVKVPKSCQKCGIKGALSSPANLRSCCRSSGNPIGSRWPHAEILPLAGLSWHQGKGHSLRIEIFQKKVWNNKEKYRRVAEQKLFAVTLLSWYWCDPMFIVWTRKNVGM